MIAGETAETTEEATSAEEAAETTEEATSAEEAAEEDSAEKAILITDQEKCTKQLAQNVKRNVKSPSNQPKDETFSAKIASLKEINNSNYFSNLFLFYKISRHPSKCLYQPQPQSTFPDYDSVSSQPP